MGVLVLTLTSCEIFGWTHFTFLSLMLSLEK